MLSLKLTLPPLKIGIPKSKFIFQLLFVQGLILLGGGLQHFLFSPRTLEEMIPISRAYFSKGLVNHQPTSFFFTCSNHLGVSKN